MDLENCRAEKMWKQRLKGRGSWEGGEPPRGLQGPAHLMARSPSKGEDEVAGQTRSPRA